MLFDAQDIAEAEREGVVRRKLAPAKAAATVSIPGLLERLTEGFNRLADLLSNQNSGPSTVNVQPPEVTVTMEPPIKEWKFTIVRDTDGRMTEITATAINR